MTTGADKERYRQYVRTWAANGALLEELRDREIRVANTAAAVRMFDQAFRTAVRDLPLRDSSGLVEWQDCMRRWCRRG